MRRKAGLLLLLLCALLLLTGCHGSGGRKAFVMPETFDEGREYTVTFWAKNDTNKTQTAIYHQCIDEFEALYPNITVDLKLYTDYGAIYNDVITNIQTDTTPNVCITYPDHIATYLTGDNVVAPLDGLMEDPDYGLGGAALKWDAPSREEIVQVYLEEGRIGEHYYALPFMRSTEATYVNVDLVEKLGYELPEVLTWDFVREVSDAAMAKDEEGSFLVNGQKTMIPFIYKSTDNMMITMLRQLGAGYSTEEGEILIFNDSVRSILAAVAEEAEKGAFSTFKISSYPGNFLNAGQCIFAVDSTAGATWMGTDAPNLDISEEKLVRFRTAVLPVPQYDTENLQMISQGPSVCVFNKGDPQEVLASWLFAQYLLSDGVQAAYSGTEGYIPVTAKALESDAYREYLAHAGEDADHYEVKIAASQLLLDHTEETFVTPVFNGSASLREAAGSLIEETAKAARRKQSADADVIFEKVKALSRLDQQVSLSEGKAELGPLPATAKRLLWALGGAWVLLGLIVLAGLAKRRKH